MNYIYYSPEKFGLKQIAELDFSSGCYEFDLTVVWQDGDGRLWYGDDSGCSCPAPFEGTGLNDLTPIKSAHEFNEHLKARQKPDVLGLTYVNDSERLAVVAKVREALAS